MNKKNIKRRKHHKFSYYVIRITICFVVFGVSLYFSFSKKTLNGISIKSDGNIGYTVKLKDNLYYEKNELPEDMDYVASLINYVDANVGYALSSSDSLDYNYTYSIDVIVKVYGDSESKPLIEKKYPIIESKNLTAKDSHGININEKVYLDYNEYNRFVANYKTSYLLSNHADLTLIMNVKTLTHSESLDSNKEINEDVKMVLPLTQQVISSNKTSPQGNNYFISPLDDGKKIQNIYTFVLGLFFGLLFILNMIRAIFDTQDIKNAAYKKELRKILNMYDLIIVNIESLIDESKYDVINVSNFNELKDVHDNVGNPIMFKETHANRQSIFVIVKDNILYKYTLNSTE